MNSRPFHSHGSSLRSRVTPASSWTTASRPPERRLTRVDLPTFGKPDDGDARRAAHARPRARAISAIRSTTSSALSEVVSTSTESSAARRAPCSRSVSRRSRSARSCEDLLDGAAALGRAAARALLVVGDQEHLERRVGADDGADVPALRHVRARARSGRAGASPSPRARRGGRRRATRAPRSRACGSPRRRLRSPGGRARPRRRSRCRRPRRRPAADHRGRRRPGSTAKATQRYIAPESR